jgi:hypothetical protein
MDGITGLSIMFFGALSLVHFARAHWFGVSPLIALLVFMFTSGVALNLPSSFLFLPSDGAYYSSWGENIAEGWVGGEQDPRPIWPGRGVLPLIIACFEFVSNGHFFSVVALNSLATTYTFFLLKLSSKVAFRPQQLNWLPLVLFLSSLPVVLYGGGLLREPFFWLGSALTVLAVAFWSQRHFPQALISFVAGASVLLAIRADLGVALIYALLGATLLIQMVSSLISRNFLRALFAGISIVAAAFTALPAIDAVRPGLTAEAVEISVADLSRPEVRTAFSPIETSEICKESILFKIVCEAVVKLPSVLLGPFPSTVFPSWNQVALSSSTIHFWIICALVIFSFRRSDLRNARPVATILTAVAITSLLIISTWLSNYGIVMRFRAITEVFLFPIALTALESFVARARKPGSGWL